MNSKEAWDTGTSWVMSAHRAWERLGDLKHLMSDPRKAQRSVQMLRSDLEEAEEKADPRTKRVFVKILATLSDLISDLNRVRWSMVGERFREDTLLTLDEMRWQIESTLPSAVSRMASEEVALRGRLIRLAYANRGLRQHLLPLIKSASYSDLEREVEDDFRRGAITRDEKSDLLQRIRKSETRRDAEKVVSEARLMRT